MRVLTIVGLVVLGAAAVYWREAWTHWVPQVTVIAQVGAVVSLALALYQLSQVGKTDRSLREISESMSTKYVGKFPEHMPEITKLLGTAKRRGDYRMRFVGIRLLFQPAAVPAVPIRHLGPGFER